MTEFTPGEWFASNMEMSKKNWALLNNGNPIEVVLRGHDVIAAVWCGDDKDGEEEANAELIASAPRTKEERDELLHEVECEERGVCLALEGLHNMSVEQYEGQAFVDWLDNMRGLLRARRDKARELIERIDRGT